MYVQYDSIEGSWITVMTSFLVLFLRKGENGQRIFSTCQYHNFKLQFQGGNNPIKTHTFSELGLKM